MSDVSTPSGLTGAGGGNLLRITGMATGLDVDGMVKKMMAAEQVKVDKAKQDQQMVVWKQQAYQDIIKDIKDLQNSFFNVSNTSNYVLSQNNFAAFNTVSSDATALAVNAGVGSKTGNYSVNFGADGHLASAAKKTGTVLNASNGFTASNWVGAKIGFSVGGAADQVITLNGINVGSTANDVVSEINNEINQPASGLAGKVQAVLNGGNIQFQALTDSSVKISNNVANTTVSSDMNNLLGKVINPSLSTTMTDLGLGGTSSLAFNYNGKAATVTINPTDKISDVINNINIATSGAVTASFSQLTNTFTMQTANTGSSQNIQVTTGFAPLGINQDNTLISGADAVVYITPPGGTATKVAKSTNNFTIDGVNYNLLKQQDSTFSVASDTQQVHDRIKSFLDKYNAIVDKIQTKLTEKKNYDYPPLTDSQKSSMKDTDIQAWNAKAQQGVLRNDSNLQQLLNNLRQAFTTPLTDSNGKNLTTVFFGNTGTGAIGVDTSSDYTSGGKITIADDGKLNNAISQYGDQFLKLFTNTSQSLDKTANFNESGIFQRINSILKDNVGYTGTTLNQAILTKYANFQDDFSISGAGGSNTLPDQIYYKQQLITKMNSDLSDKQERYYQQFAKLETAMNQLNAQQSQLSQSLGG